ncbi:MAG: tRNA pseudouridine(13) synthase TruD, partial [Nanoarchaeota archaeon]|nr:tRNA pseudouridine(13) synthase TruD [Nanoarchaeota archaeon]
DDLIVKKEITGIITKIMQKENITEQDFIIKQIPELSQEGELRAAFAEIKNLAISELEEDDLNTNKKKLKLTFTLNKGSYATMAIKKLIAQ